MNGLKKHPPEALLCLEILLTLDGHRGFVGYETNNLGRFSNQNLELLSRRNHVVAGSSPIFMWIITSKILNFRLGWHKRKSEIDRENLGIGPDLHNKI